MRGLSTLVAAGSARRGRSEGTIGEEEIRRKELLPHQRGRRRAKGVWEWAE